MIQIRYLLFFLSSGLCGMYLEFKPQDDVLQILLEQPNIHFTKGEKSLLQNCATNRQKSSAINLFYMKKNINRIISSNLKSSDQETTQFLWAGELKHFAHNKMLLNMNDAIQGDLTVRMLKKVNNYVCAVVIMGTALLIAYQLSSPMQESEK